MSGDIEVVISGVGGIFSRCNNLEEFQEKVLDNEYLVNYSNRWQKGATGFDPWVGETNYKLFDHLFFGMHKLVAYWCDPTYRLGFERIFEAIIDAGLNPASLRGSSTRVYNATCASDFNISFIKAMYAAEGYALLGHNQAMSCNRNSYIYDLTGESVALGGSSECIHQAFGHVLEAIRAEECDSAVLVMSSVAAYSHLSRSYKGIGTLSEDGITRSFDKNGTGSVRSDGVVAFMVQRADQAKRCYAKVVGGRGGYMLRPFRFDMTLPSPVSFENFIRTLYQTSRVDPDDVVYVEADGVGAPLMDAAELTALGRVFGTATRAGSGRPLLVGSAKSNVANADTVSGAISVCRAIIAMESGIIPATINCNDPITTGGSAVEVVRNNRQFCLDAKTTVGVNTIGTAGQMGHVILKPNLKDKPQYDSDKELPRLVPICSRTDEAAHEVAEKIKSYPFDPEYLRLVQDVFSPGIRGYEFRTYVICPPLPDETVKVERLEKRVMWYVYSGMGSQWAGMGAGLMELPIFRDTIERLHAVLEPKGVDLKHIITETGSGAYDNILKSFVGITACQIALTNILSEMGLKPDGIIGHSVGEVACGYADDCLTEEQTILAAWARGKASNEATLIKGMMAAVGLGYRDIVNRLPPTIEVACRNSSTSSTISGPAEDVHAFVKTLTAEGVFARAVNVSNIAYHSRYIQAAGPFLLKHLKTVITNPKKRSPKWVSTSVPKERQNRPEAQYCSAEYQTNNLLSPVLFEDSLKFIPEQALVVEVAPHGLLQAILKRELTDNLHVSLCQRNSSSPMRTILNAIGQISTGGANPNVSVLYPPVNFPVSRGTPSLAPLVKWYHENSATYTGDLIGANLSTLEQTLAVDSPHMLVKGVRLYALSEMLELVLKCMMNIKEIEGELIKVVFENVHVLNYEAISADGSASSVSANVNKGSGRFEVVLHNLKAEKNSKDEEKLLAFGYIQIMKDDSQFKTLPKDGLKDMECINGDEVLNDLASRGIAYSGKYVSLASVDVGVQDWMLHIREGRSFALIVEAAIQAALLRQMEQTEMLLMTTSIQRLEVDTALCDKDFSIHYHTSSGVMQAPGFYMTGLKASEPNIVTQPLNIKTPMSFQYVPFGKTNLQTVGEFLSLAVQLAMESFPETQKANIQILELQNCAGSNVLGPAVRSLLQERMGIQAEVKTLTVGKGKKFFFNGCESQSPCLTISGPSTLVEGARMVAHTGGLLLTRSSERPSLTALRVLAEQKVETDWITLLCRSAPLEADTCVVKMASTDPLPARLHMPTILVWRGQPVGGVASTVEEIKKRPYAKKCRLVFILDEDAPEFSVSDPMYAQQLQLNQRINVLRRGVWGSWRALPLTGTGSAALSFSCLGGVRILALGLNPRDREEADNGKSIWSGHMDYVGFSDNAGRVMGVAQWSSDRSRPKLDPLLCWKVPDSWSDKKAATVPYAYAMVYQALCVKMGLQEGESILIHEGASAIGQAAIRVALQFNCSPIIVTVASEEQRSLIRKYFPQIDQRFVLSSIGTKFEWQIRVQTKCRGVDVLLNGLPGAQLKASLNCVGKYGRVVHYGREDMLSSDSSIGMRLFNRSAAMYGMTGDDLFKNTKHDRKALVLAVQEGIEKGVVQPIIGSKSFSAPRLFSPEDARWIRGDINLSKAVLEVPVNGIHGPQECSALKSYVIIGGDHHEWLQVAGWLSLQGARKVLAVPGGKFNGALVRHRQRSFRQQFGTSVRIQEIRSWDRAAADTVVKAAEATAPIDAVIVLVKDDPSSARIPALLHAALAAHPTAALLVLAEHAQAAYGLSTLCEARRSAGLRTACLSGRLDSAADHLVDMMSGARPAVTMIPVKLGDGVDCFEPRITNPIPSSSGALAALGKNLMSLPLSGVRLRELRRICNARENSPVFAIPPLGVMDSETETSLLKLAKRVVSPLVCLEYQPEGDIQLLARKIVQTLITKWPTGPFNLLGWTISNPLTLEVAQRLEDMNHNAITVLVDGDVNAVHKWASSISDLSLLRIAFTDDERSPEVLDEASDKESWSRLVPQVLTQCTADPHLVDIGLQALRLTVQNLAKHKPQVSQPVRCRLVAVRTRVADSCSFNLTDEHFEPMVMPIGETRHGIRSSWLATVINENSGWFRLSRPDEMYKLLQ